jgi:hypothetical protein
MVIGKLATPIHSTPWALPGGLPDRRLTGKLGLLHMDATEMQKLCDRLNEFALPRAIVDFNIQRFVAWNTRFLARTGYSEDEIKTLELGKTILLGDSIYSPPHEGDNPTAEFVALAVRVPTKTAAVPGHMVRSQKNFGYLMLHGIEPTTSIGIEEARLVGKEQERVRIVQMFHEEVSPDIIAALLQIQMAKDKLREGDRPEAEQVTAASEMLSDAVEKIDKILEEKKDEPRAGT